MKYIIELKNEPTSQYMSAENSSLPDGIHFHAVKKGTRVNIMRVLDSILRDAYSGMVEITEITSPEVCLSKGNFAETVPEIHIYYKDMLCPLQEFVHANAQGKFHIGGVYIVDRGIK